MPEKKKRRTGNGTSFIKGQSGNPSGRPKGVPNKVTRDVRTLCQDLVSRPKYQAWVAEQLDAGTLPPPLQQMIWAYGYGKPVQALDLNVSFDPVKYLARDDEADDD